MADDVGRLLVRIEATQAAFEKQMAAIAAAGAKAAGDVELKFKKANDNIKKGGPQAAASINKTTQAATQLSFQLNDIATSLAGGSSWFQVMMQQGSQVTQVFQQMGGGIKGAVGVLTGAFTSMLNPISLVSFGLIAATGYAVQYFTASEKGSKAAAKAAKDEADAIKKMADAYGDLFPELKRIADLRKAEADAAEKAEAAETAVSGAYKTSQKTIDALVLSFTRLVRLLNDLGVSAGEISNLQKVFGGLTASVEAFDANSEDAKTVVAQLNAVIATQEGQVKTLATAIRDQLVAAFNELDRAASAAEQTMRRAVDIPFSLPGAGGALDLGPAVKARGDYVTRSSADTMKFIKSRAASTEIAESLDRLDSDMAEALARLLSILPDTARITSGVRTYEEQARIRARHEAMPGGVAAHPAARAGTSRHEMGTLREGGAAVDIGQGVSMAELRAAVKLVPELEQLDSVSESLYQRDKVHVQLKGTALKQERETAEAVVQKEQALLKARDALQDYLNGLDQQASLQTRINEIEKSGLSAEDKIKAIEVEKEVQNALNQAKALGITLTQQEIALVREKAIANAMAGIQSDQIKAAAKASADALKDAQRSADEFNKAVQGAVGGLIKDLIAGRDAAEAFGAALQKIADKAIDMALQNLFSMGGPGAAGGMLGGAVIPGILHKGGVAGVHGYGSGRAVSASAFAGAKRYHSGGMIGAGEVPAILKRGEIVLPAGAAKKGGGTETVNIRLQDDSGRMSEIADQRIQTASGAIVKVSVVQATKSVSKRLPGMMANAQVRAG